MNFVELYEEVFDKNNKVTVCGRDKCKQLINIANTVEPEVFHGDLKTGYMNIASMINLYNKLKK